MPNESKKDEKKDEKKKDEKKKDEKKKPILKSAANRRLRKKSQGFNKCIKILEKIKGNIDTINNVIRPVVTMKSRDEKYYDKCNGKFGNYLINTYEHNKYFYASYGMISNKYFDKLNEYDKALNNEKIKELLKDDKLDIKLTPEFEEALKVYYKNILILLETAKRKGAFPADAESRIDEIIRHSGTVQNFYASVKDNLNISKKTADFDFSKPLEELKEAYLELKKNAVENEKKIKKHIGEDYRAAYNTADENKFLHELVVLSKMNEKDLMAADKSAGNIQHYTAEDISKIYSKKFITDNKANKYALPELRFFLKMLRSEWNNSSKYDDMIECISDIEAYSRGKMHDPLILMEKMQKAKRAAKAYRKYAEPIINGNERRKLKMAAALTVEAVVDEYISKLAGIATVDDKTSKNGVKNKKCIKFAKGSKTKSVKKIKCNGKGTAKPIKFDEDTKKELTDSYDETMKKIDKYIKEQKDYMTLGE